MTPQERDVLLPLLDRLRQTRVASKDAEADQLIRQAVQAQPDAPYILAQTVLMQDYALHAAQDRVRALEQQLAQGAQHEQHPSGGGFLAGLFGGRGQPAPSGGALPGGAGVPATPGYANPGYPANPGYATPGYGAQIASAVQPGAGGPSFLRGAAQTAAGVAGGMLLAQGLEDLVGHHGAGGASGFLGDALGGNAGDLGRGGDFGGASVDRFVEDASRDPAGADVGSAGYADTDTAGGDAGDYTSGDASGDTGNYAGTDTGTDTGADAGGYVDDGGFDGSFDDSTS